MNQKIEQLKTSLEAYKFPDKLIINQLISDLPHLSEFERNIVCSYLHFILCIIFCKTSNILPDEEYLAALMAATIGSVKDHAAKIKSTY